MRDGRLQAGDRLPPHRTMAEALGIDLATVTRAYGEAIAQGLLEATVGRGTFVRSDAPIVRRRYAKQASVDLAMNLPPIPSESDFRQMLRSGLERLLRHDDLASLMTYHWDTGSSDERRAGALWLQPCLGTVEGHRILVAPGAQSAMLAVLNCLARPGDVVLSERLTYPGIRGLAAQLGITLVGIDTDDEGFVPEALDRACHELQPRAIYCNPTIQNPTTLTMSVARREAVAEIAQSYGIPILEDDAYGLLPIAPLPALARFAPDLVFYVSTTAKSLSPGLRMAYLVAPSRPDAERVTAALRGMVQMTSGLLSGLVTRWIESGEAVTMLNAIRDEQTRRQEIAAEILDPRQVRAHPQGPHLWLDLPREWSSAEFVNHARRDGLAMVPSDRFIVELPDARPGVRVALGACRNREQLRDGLQALAAILRRPMPPTIYQGR